MTESSTATGLAPDGPVSDAEPDPLLGRNVGRKFVLEKLLGAGAMGAVYRARQTALEKVVAIKVMHGELARDPMFAGRFHREAKAASRLDHPNSIRIIDYGQDDDGLLYIAMEYLDGRDLGHLLTYEWPLPTVRTIDLLAQALGAIAVAHDLGITHRDLKPENIMVLRRRTDEGADVDVVKVCDFGIAKLVEAADESPPSAAQRTGRGNLTTAGLVIGTPAYMSPEQGRGDAIDARSDLYSVGVILYQMLTGLLPFDAPSAIGIVLKHQSEEPKPPSSINPSIDRRIEAVCMRAMQKRPADRYQTARELRAALREASDSTWTGPATMSRDAMPLPSTIGTAPGFPTAPLTAGTAPFASSGAPFTQPQAVAQQFSPSQAIPQYLPPTTQPALAAAGVAQAQIGVAKTELNMAAVPTSSAATVPVRPAEARRRWPLVVAASAVILAALGVVAVGLNRTRHVRREVPIAASPPPSVAPPPTLPPDHQPSVPTETTKLSAPENPMNGPHEMSHAVHATTLPKHVVTPIVPEPAAPSPAAVAPPAAPAPETPPSAVVQPAAPPNPPAPAPAPAAPTYDLTRASVSVLAATNLNGTTPSKVATPLGRARDSIAACYRSALPAISVAGGGLSGIDTLHIEMDSLRISSSKLKGPVMGGGIEKCIDGVVMGLSVQDADTGSFADVPLEFKPL